MLLTEDQAYGIALLNRSVAVEPALGGKGVTGGYDGGAGLAYGNRGAIVAAVPIES